MRASLARKIAALLWVSSLPECSAADHQSPTHDGQPVVFYTVIASRSGAEISNRNRRA
ncbi:putative lipoprotein [Janthinobacterium agaricidamnosum NBRC 102515 = DSM 9628]|uniref:Putative lipoprotein n=1 Tax=Janthinobacterium agaricidamnosum NBRC 102515 = DSM 9628 TaxID=1349767 RepID=W0VDD2_9BURK|nr:putative lipoprotein [Janthinobacterium agaricidamnosum NBRC 102515 = DSM 9628]